MKRCITGALSSFVMFDNLHYYIPFVYIYGILEVTEQASGTLQVIISIRRDDKEPVHRSHSI